ncbi:hypothetical protein AC1031_013229 [Aphanomyces cochlioides]|nr:hypothetical protein AC1031_013227 [Aphanomyces cochlioides]KAG9414028.1 hypothetical protein AC1031_013229 [Aphanomyces cochlioides]
MLERAKKDLQDERARAQPPVQDFSLQHEKYETEIQFLEARLHEALEDKNELQDELREWKVALSEICQENYLATNLRKGVLPLTELVVERMFVLQRLLRPIKTEENVSNDRTSCRRASSD